MNRARSFSPQEHYLLAYEHANKQVNNVLKNAPRFYYSGGLTPPRLTSFDSSLWIASRHQAVARRYEGVNRSRRSSNLVF